MVAETNFKMCLLKVKNLQPNNVNLKNTNSEKSKFMYFFSVIWGP